MHDFVSCVRLRDVRAKLVQATATETSTPAVRSPLDVRVRVSNSSGGMECRTKHWELQVFDSRKWGSNVFLLPLASFSLNLLRRKRLVNPFACHPCFTPSLSLSWGKVPEPAACSFVHRFIYNSQSMHLRVGGRMTQENPTKPNASTQKHSIRVLYR